MAAKPSAYWSAHESTLMALVEAHRRSTGEVPWARVQEQMPAPAPTIHALRFKYRELHQANPSTTGSTLTVAPFAVPIPAPATLSPGGLVAVILPDTHIGMEDPRAIAVAMAIVQEAQPDIVVHLGDLLDAYWLSRFDKDPANPTRLQDEIDGARVFLHQVAQLAPQARRVLLEGNHERRLTKAIWGMPGTAAEIGRLTAFREAITWPRLLDLDAIGWEWVPEQQQSKVELLPGLITKHGTVVRKWSALSAQGEWQRYSVSGVSGHTHRLGAFYHADRNGSHVWVECGCLCSTDPEYAADPDWQQGLVVITWSEDGTRYNVEPIYIQGGRAVWRGRTIRA